MKRLILSRRQFAGQSGFHLATPRLVHARLPAQQKALTLTASDPK